MSRSDATAQPPSTPGEPATPHLGYGAAMAELEVILNRLEDDQLDIDELADLVGRGAQLMALCRDRLDTAKLRVTEIVADLEESSSE